MATYSENGQLIDDSRAAFKTMDPDIVKVMYQPGMEIPELSAVGAPDENGIRWLYTPTDTAKRMGKIVAALDTFSALPEQISEQVQSVIDAAPSIAKWVVIGVAAYAVFEVMKRGR